MIGVILWSDSVRRKAVIWAEDQSDLVFLTDANIGEDDPVFEVVDVVEFEMHIDCNLRRAKGVRCIDALTGIDARERLQSMPSEQSFDVASRSAEIIPLHSPDPVEQQDPLMPLARISR